MKKLMTMLSAAALAIGAQAADPSGTSFEGMTRGDLDLTTGEGLLWETNDVNSQLQVVDLAGGYSSALRAQYYQYQSTAGDQSAMLNALSIETGLGAGNVAYRSNDGTTNAMGSVYVDVLVKPTICDADTTITLDDGAKIAIWFRDDENGTTNLMITAGYINSENSILTTNYVCNAIVGADFSEWQRFTIKSFGDIKTGANFPGFVVFRNGIAVTSSSSKGDSSVFNSLDSESAYYYGKNALFPSLVGALANKGKELNAIGFSGKGEIDDILFTDNLPNEDFATVKTFTLAWDANVTRFSYQVGTDAVVNQICSGAGSIALQIAEDTSVVIRDREYAAGYIEGDLTFAGPGVSIDVNSFALNKADLVDGTSSGTITAAAAGVRVTVGEGEPQFYPTLDAAFGAIVSAESAVTMTLNADGLELGSAVALSAPDAGVTIDLAGKTFTYEGEGYALNASVPLTITNSVPATGGITAANGVVTSSAALTIYGGTFDGAVTVTAGTAAISGGTFMGTTTLVANSVTGGTFANDPTDYLALGYGAPLVDGVYVVGFATYDIVYFGDYNEQTEEYEELDLTPKTYTYGDAEIALPTPVKSGYTFAGWVDSEENPFSYVSGTTYGDLELYASWTEDPSGDDWNTPTEDTPAAVEEALKADGFSGAVTNIVTTLDEFTTFVNYVKTQTGAATPAALTPAQVANAALCYALQSSTIPATEIAGDDVTIESIEKNATNDAAVDIVVAIDGVTAGDDVPAATLEKIVTAMGGTSLGAMSTANVEVSGYATEDGKVNITVTPVGGATPTSFFTQVIINK